MMIGMIDVTRREQLRRRIGSAVSMADRLCEAVTNPGLRKRISAVSINITAVEVFFLDVAPLPAHEEKRWLGVAEHWLAVHTSVLRGCEFEAAANDTSKNTDPSASAAWRPEAARDRILGSQPPR
jgi:hypothetical protein